MFYSHCPYMCPRIVSDLKRLQKSLSPDARKRVGLVLVSIDPKRDSTTRLQTFAQEQGLDPSTWTLLSGNSGAVQELAAALGFKYRGSGKTFVHSYLISIIDSDGLIQTQLSQAGPAPQAVVQRINALK